MKANVPQLCEAHLPGSTKTARWQKNESLMVFVAEAKSAALANAAIST